MCNRLSRIENVDLTDYLDISFKIETIEFEEFKFPDLTSISLVDDIVNKQGKYLVYASDTQKNSVEHNRFFTVGRITSFANFLRPGNLKSGDKDYLPFTRITITDLMATFPEITLFANKMTKIASSLTENVERIIDEKITTNTYLEKLRHIPMIFKIRLDYYMNTSNSSGTTQYLTNRLCEYIDFCPHKFYKDWIKRMRKNMEELWNCCVK